MANLDPSRRRASRILGWHALGIGAGWFVVAFPALLLYGSSAGFKTWASELPSAAQGALAVGVLLCATPVLWPLYMAIGWHEGRLAERVAAGEVSAVRTAVRLLTIQALAAGVVALFVAFIALSAEQGSWVRDHFSLAWLLPVAVASAHLVTRRGVMTG